MSRREAEVYSCKLPHLLISIESPSMDKPSFFASEARIATLRLDFDDYEEPHKELSVAELTVKGHGPVFFNSAHAQKIADFVIGHIDRAELIITQCHAGLSRSAGVSLALAEWYAGEGLESGRKQLIARNRLVHKTLSETLINIEKARGLTDNSLPEDFRS